MGETFEQVVNRMATEILPKIVRRVKALEDQMEEVKAVFESMRSSENARQCKKAKTRREEVAPFAGMGMTAKDIAASLGVEEADVQKIMDEENEAKVADTK